MRIDNHPMIIEELKEIERLESEREKARQKCQFRHMRDLDKRIAREQKMLQEAKEHLRRAGWTDGQSNDN